MERYKVLKELGKGAQGVVLKAECLTPPLGFKEGKFPKYVAIKRMKPSQSDSGITLATIREIMILREFNNENIISILDIFVREEYIYMVMPFMIGDLEELIRAKNKILLSPSDIKAYMYQILNGINYCHNKYIIHRDMKPNNCLLGSDGILRISDFGLSREYGSPNRKLSHETCTIWYRCPELLFGSNYYSTNIDIWSIGCIFGELMLRCPLFPGENEIDQLIKIFTIMGVPNNNIWKDINLLQKYKLFNNKEAIPLTNLFPSATKEAIDLFSNLMKFDPNKRISAENALKHNYFNKDSKIPMTPIKQLPALTKLLKPNTTNSANTN